MAAKRHIVLIGFSGSGKSTIGPLLAARLKRRFIDIDQGIEADTGLTIANIFEHQGEKSFRRREIDLLVEGLNRPRATVIALGGGAFESRAIRTIARERGLVVYLSCSRREIYRRLKDQQDRPLLEVKPAAGQTRREARLARIAGLVKKRLANYRTADLVVSTTGRSPARVTQQLLRMIDRK